jgi:hypothetical protein
MQPNKVRLNVGTIVESIDETADRGNVASSYKDRSTTSAKFQNFCTISVLPSCRSSIRMNQFLQYCVALTMQNLLLIFSLFAYTFASVDPKKTSGLTAFGLPGGNDDTYTILNETVMYDGWRRLIRRTVLLPSSLQVDFEIVAQKGSDKAVLVFVWDSATKRATLIREYMPSVHRLMFGLAAGMVEDKHAKHLGNDSLIAAEHELEEECRMKGGTWYSLTAGDVVLDKYSSTGLSVYLVVDPTSIAESDAKPRDETEEGMQVVHGVSVDEIRRKIAAGEMTVVGGWASMLALDKLRELGEIR